MRAEQHYPRHYVRQRELAHFYIFGIRVSRPEIPGLPALLHYAESESSGRNGVRPRICRKLLSRHKIDLMS